MSFAQNYTARFSLGTRLHCKSGTFFFLEVVLYFFFSFKILSKSCCDSNTPSKTYSTITFITHSKCTWHISAFTLIHQGWHSHAVKPLNNWSILWATLRLKCGIPCFLLCPLADVNASILQPWNITLIFGNKIFTITKAFPCAHWKGLTYNYSFLCRYRVFFPNGEISQFHLFLTLQGSWLFVISRLKPCRLVPSSSFSVKQNVIEPISFLYREQGSSCWCV